jgi:tRNA(Arg) A34 adenosine deaminase TadA
MDLNLVVTPPSPKRQTTDVMGVLVTLVARFSEMKNVTVQFFEAAPFIDRAIALADEARSEGNHPLGAVLVKNNEIVLEAKNSVNSMGDVTRHAELNLLQNAAQALSREDLESCILYSSTEPCSMCSGAIYWAGIRSVVYGCSKESLQKLTSGKSVSAQFIGPVSEAAALLSHQSFWDKKI